MKAIRSVKNQYSGINAHLHSYWQNAGGWADFHTNHITDLMRLMRAQLLPMGYTAGVEQSLQIRRVDNRFDRPESDISIYDLDPERPTYPRVLPIPEILGLSEVAEKPFNAVAVYRAGQRTDPVAWVELLSPSNKPGGQDDDEYLSKRLKVLRRGIVFVEIDYLHESAPTFAGVAQYQAHRKNQPVEIGSHPYRILVIDPRPSLDAGQAHIIEFDVDRPIPIMTIPLNADDVLKFDFGAAYSKTFEETLYGMELVDYSQIPLRFERYSEDDQAQIASRMVSILDAARQGIDLESGPFPVETLSLEDALHRLQTLTQQA
jgi:hypothetical protein